MHKILELIVHVYSSNFATNFVVLQSVHSKKSSLSILNGKRGFFRVNRDFYCAKYDNNTGNFHLCLLSAGLPYSAERTHWVGKYMSSGAC